MKGATLLLTGGTGFIAERLLRQLVQSDCPKRIITLVQEKFLDTAHEIGRSLSQLAPNLEYEVIVGDITKPKLGISNNSVVESIDWVWHLAAVYDLSIEKRLAEEINVIGTQNVIDFCNQLESTPYLLYFSTCYVCGKREGEILESDLTDTHGFKNHYEWSKFEAERRIRRDYPKAITVRPAIVVGDSQSGVTAKFDGPYVTLPSISRLAWIPGGVPAPRGGNAHVNLVPVDYVVSTTLELCRHPEKNAGETFQVCDPHPCTVDELYELMTEAITGRGPGLPIPRTLFRILARAPISRQIIGIPLSTLPYFEYDSRFDCRKTTRALGHSKIQCPRLPDYLPKLIEFWKDNANQSGYHAKF